MIKFTNVFKKFADGFEAIKNLNLTINDGEMVFLTGHSGAGKSTLLKLVMMLERSTRGKIVVNGADLNKLKQRKVPYFRRQIGVVFQDPRLLENRNIYENVAVPLLLRGYDIKKIAKNVRAALDIVGLSDKENRLPKTLSEGERQRVGIARAVIAKPTILLADEPTGNLDTALSYEIMDLFSRLNKYGSTVLIATHDLDIIKDYNYRVLTLKQGSLIDDKHV